MMGLDAIDAAPQTLAIQCGHQSQAAMAALTALSVTGIILDFRCRGFR